jgi:Helitron helicase-like domain at N-terminus
MLIRSRWTQLNDDFLDLCLAEENWPPPLPDMKKLYSDFYSRIHEIANPIVCACCGCIDYDPSHFNIVPSSYTRLSLLRVDPDLVNFEFSCQIPELDEQHIMVDSLVITRETDSSCNLNICKLLCNTSLEDGEIPLAALANYRWLGPVPPELQDLTFMEERVIAQATSVAVILRLQKRDPSSYEGLKGHTILLPQDTTPLVTMLPASRASLANTVNVVWVGKSVPDRDQLRRYFTIRRQKVEDALKWLIANNKDYKTVSINPEFETWPAVSVADDILECMGHVLDPTVEDAGKSGVASEDIDIPEVEGDLPYDASAIIDVNNTSTSKDSDTLLQLSHLQSDVTADGGDSSMATDETTDEEDDLQILVDTLQHIQLSAGDGKDTEDPSNSTSITIEGTLEEATINIVSGNKIINQRDKESYYTATYPTLFPWGIGKHEDRRRQTNNIPIKLWVRLLLRNSSRFVPALTYSHEPMAYANMVCRRFQAHKGFVALSFDNQRRQHISTKAHLFAQSPMWSVTQRLLDPLTSEQLTHAANESEQHRPLDNPRVKELLRLVNRIGETAPGSDEKKSYQLVQLKSAVCFYGCPLIFLTLNPAERHSPLTLSYAGEEINVQEFYPELYSAAKRLMTAMKNPLAAVDYFYNTINTVINKALKGGMFGELLHHDGPVEYGGRGLQHTHLAVLNLFDVC